jgi:hypothetical protein
MLPSWIDDDDKNHTREKGDAGDVARLVRSMHSSMRQHCDDGPCTHDMAGTLLPRFTTFVMPKQEVTAEFLPRPRCFEWADPDANLTLETKFPLLSPLSESQR